MESKIIQITEEDLELAIEHAVQNALSKKMAHPSQRAPITKFKDPSSGLEWISTTVKKGEVLRKGIIIISAILIAFVAIVQFADRWFGTPHIKSIVDKEISLVMNEHDKNVREKMDMVRQQYDQRFKQQEEFNESTKQMQEELRKDVKEILRKLG